MVAQPQTFSSRPRNSLARTAGSVGVLYGASIGCLFAGEVLLARHLTTAEFGQYNLVRQCLPFVVALALLGYDQSLTRETAARGGRPPRLDRRQCSLILLAGGTGGLAAVYLIVRLNVSVGTAATLVVTGAAVATTSLVSGVMRASSRPALGAVSQQGYRLFAGLVFVATSTILTGFLASVVLATSAVVVAVACIRWSRKLTSFWHVTSLDHRLMRRLGIGYSLSMLSLALGDWLDSALIAELSGDLGLVGRYGQVKLIALYPLLSVGSILGFVALPTIAARRQTLNRPQVIRWLLVAGALAATAGALMIPLVRFLTQSLFEMRPSWLLVVMLSFVGALRLYYVLPSALLGATATVHRLAGFGIMGIVGVVIQLGVTLWLSHGDVLMAGAAGLLSASVVRVMSSTVLCLEISWRPRVRAGRTNDGTAPTCSKQEK